MSKLYDEVSKAFNGFNRNNFEIVSIEEFDEHEVDVTLNYNGADRPFKLLMDFIDDFVYVFGVDSNDLHLKPFEIIQNKMTATEAVSDRLFSLYESFLSA